MGALALLLIWDLEVGLVVFQLEIMAQIGILLFQARVAGMILAIILEVMYMEVEMATLV